MSAKLDISTEDLIVTMIMRQLLSCVCGYLYIVYSFYLQIFFLFICFLLQVTYLHLVYFETIIGHKRYVLFHLCGTKSEDNR